MPSSPGNVVDYSSTLNSVSGTRSVPYRAPHIDTWGHANANQHRTYRW